MKIYRLLIAILLTAGGLSAQTDLSTVRGTALDPGGAVVPKAAVTLTNLRTGLTRATTTNQNGDFEIPYLVPGAYRLNASSPGFKTFVANNIVLESLQVRRIDVHFAIGETVAEVTVSAGAALIETDRAEIATGYDKQRWQYSPLGLTYFPQNLMQTLPGIQGRGNTMYFSGQPGSQISESMDGVSDDGTVNLVNTMDDFAEVQALPVNASAEFSRVGNFNLSGKSGGNDLHGNLFYILDNSALNAQGFFDTQKNSAKQHRARAELSGPIRKNKTFFYSSYLLTRIPSGFFVRANVPTEQFRRGDFSQLATGARPVQILDPLSGQPFPNNAIPASRFNPTAQKIQDTYIPPPNRGTPDSRVNNFEWLHRWASDLYRWDSIAARTDHSFSAKNTFFARYITRMTPYVLAGALPEVGTWTRKRYHHAIAVSDTHVFSPTLVNTARFGWLKDYFIDGDETDGFRPVTGDSVVSAIGLQGVNPRRLSAMGFPVLNITGVTTMRVTPGGVALDDRYLSYANSVSW
jgi:hypothetical protein